MAQCNCHTALATQHLLQCSFLSFSFSLSSSRCLFLTPFLLFFSFRKSIGAPMDFSQEKVFACASKKPRITSVCFSHNNIGEGKKTLVGTRSGEIFEIEQSEGNTGAGSGHDGGENGGENGDKGHDHHRDHNASQAYIHRISKSHFKGELWGLATHPHKHYFVTCGDDKTVRLWDANLRRQRASRPLPLKARAAAISPDGDTIALALWDGTVYVLDG